MPVILRYKGYRFFFFSNEGNPLEPVYVHVRSGARVAKYWMEPEISLAESYELSPSELKEIENVVRENQSQIKEAWNDHLGSYGGGKKSLV